MGLFLYQVVRRHNGWAYRLENTYSRIFTTQWEAIEAAKVAAREMHEQGDYTQVRIKDGPFGWRTELVISGAH